MEKATSTWRAREGTCGPITVFNIQIFQCLSYYLNIWRWAVTCWRWNTLGLKKGKIRECAESDREILTLRLILMFHGTHHWWSNSPVSALGRGSCLPACGGQQFPAGPAGIWYHLSASEDGKRHLQGPDPTREQQSLKQPLSDNLD